MSQGLLTFSPGTSPFYLDKGKGVLEGTSDRDISCLTRNSCPGELQPQTKPFLKSPYSSGPLWACTCSAGGAWPSSAWWCTEFPAASLRPAFLQMHSLVENAPAARTAAWTFHHPLSVPLVSCWFPSPAQPTGVESLPSVISRALMARGHMISWCWLPGSRAPWSLSSQPLISPLRGGERAEALLLWEGGASFPTAATLPSCLAAFALGLVCWLLLPGWSQEPLLGWVVMGLLLSFHVNSEQPPRPCSFQPFG